MKRSWLGIGGRPLAFRRWLGGLMLGLTLAEAAFALTATASPTTCSNVAGVGTVSWSNSTNAYTSNNGYATATTSATGMITTNYLQCSGFGFNIPAGATITGITVNVERSVSSTWSISPKDSVVQMLKAGSITGSNRATSTTYTTGDVVEAHGSGSDLWGTTWTVADINNAAFGVAYSASYGNKMTTNSRTISVDQIQVTVTYTVGAWPPGSYVLTASPGACVNLTGVGTLAWSNPGNAVSSNDSYTTTSTSSTGTVLTNYLKCTGYGFALPTSAVIDGIGVGVERKINRGLLGIVWVNPHDSQMADG